MRSRRPRPLGPQPDGCNLYFRRCDALRVPGAHRV